MNQTQENANGIQNGTENNGNGSKKLGLWALIWVLFAVVCGGAYGLEESLPTTGPGLGLILILVIPFLWAIPISFITAELASAIPREGGHVRWVHRAMGGFMSFQAGWLAWIRNIVDTTLYPVLFVDYLRFFYPDISQSERFMICLGLVALFTMLNLAGIKVIGASSTVFSLIVLAPFIIMIILGFRHGYANPWHPIIPEGKTLLSCFGTGLMIIIWNYNGWEDFATCLGEIKNPSRNYPLGLLLAVPLIAGIYFLTLYASLGASSNWASWESGSFPVVGASIAGKWLGVWLTLAILAGNANQLMTIITSTSRIPFALAQEKYLPPVFLKVIKKTGAPWVAILFCSFFIMVLSQLSFKNLINIEIYLYGSQFLLEFISLIILRVKEPGLARTVRIPGGLTGVILLGLLPCGILILAIATSEYAFAGTYFAVVLLGFALYLPFRKISNGRITPMKPAHAQE